MRLVSLEIEGIRGIERETVQLGPVTAFWGPNGSGKTTMVGAVIYALTGRFPGLVVPGKAATSHDVILKLATNPVEGFRVRLMLDDGQIERRVSSQKTTLAVEWKGDRSRGNEAAEKMLADMVGDVGWAVDMFDPEKSVWRMSPEKRKAWAMGVCASASGWTHAKLLDAAGPATDDWDPSLHRDAGTCLEMNLERIDGRLKAAQKVVREAVVITEGVSSDSEHSVRDAIVRLESQVEQSRAEAERLKRLLDNADTEQTCIERERRARAQLTPQIREMKAKIDALIPPAEPEAPVEALATIEQLSMDAVVLSMAREEVAETERSLTEAKILTQSDISTFTRYQVVASATGCCPLCGVTGQWKGSELGAKVAELKQKATVIAQQLAANWDERDRVMTQQAQADETHRQATLLVAMYEEERSTYAARCATFEQGFEAMINSVQTMEAQLASLPADRLDLDRVALAAKHAEAQAALAQLSAEVGAERQKLGVAAHRQGQLTAQTAAERRTDQLKALLVSLKRVRDRMLDDAVAPLRTALESLDPICLKGWQWTLRREGTALDMVMRLKDGTRSLTVETLSVGERYLATIALLVGKAMVQRERWSGLFMDNFEAVFPESARMVVLEGLVEIASLVPGPIDNVLAAGACAAPTADWLAPGLRSYTRTAR